MYEKFPGYGREKDMITMSSNLNLQKTNKDHEQYKLGGSKRNRDNIIFIIKLIFVT